MTIASLASEVSSLALLLRVIGLTLFYAALAWLPLRGTAAVVGLMHRQKLRRRKRSRPPEPELENAETTWEIR